MRLVQPETVDAVVAGGSLAGIVAGAILANRGYEVVVLEATDHPGSRVGSRLVDGYWVDWGHRDGHGVGDLAFAPVFTKKAAELAGVSLPLRPFVGRCLRVHWLPERRVVELPMETVVGSGGDPVAQMAALARAFAIGQGREDQVARATVELLGRLAALDEEEAWRLVPVRLEDWLRRHAPDPDVRRLVLQQNELVPLGPNESLGRFALHLRSFAGESAAVVVDHDQVGGVQGIVAAFTEGLERRGGRLLTGLKPLEIVVEDHEARGVVALDESSLVRVFDAAVVITDYPGSALAHLVDPSLLPAGFLEAAHQVERYGMELVSLWAGLSRLPHRRQDGAPEDHAAPWQRVLRGKGDVHHVYGGWFFPSAFSRRSAPPGKHLLTYWLEPVSETGGRGWRTFAEAKAALDVALDYLCFYYADLEDCIEWARVQYVTPPAWLSWYLKPCYRHPIKVSTVDGLYVAAATAEGTGSFLDIECAAGLAAADLADAERGHLVRSRA